MYFNNHFNNHSFNVIFGLWKILLNKSKLFNSSWSTLYFTELIFQKTRIFFHCTFSCSQHAVHTQCAISFDLDHLVDTSLCCLLILLCESTLAQFIYCFFFFLNLLVVSSVYFLLIALSFSWSLPTWLLVAEGWKIIYWLWANPLT